MMQDRLRVMGDHFRMHWRFRVTAGHDRFQVGRPGVMGDGRRMMPVDLAVAGDRRGVAPVDPDGLDRMVFVDFGVTDRLHRMAVIRLGVMGDDLGVPMARLRMTRGGRMMFGDQRLVMMNDGHRMVDDGPGVGGGRGGGDQYVERAPPCGSAEDGAEGRGMCEDRDGSRWRALDVIEHHLRRRPGLG